MKLGFNYDKIMGKIGLKYVVPIIAAKRAEVLKNTEELEQTKKSRDYVTKAMKEMEEGTTFVKNQENLDSIRTDLE